MQDDKRTKFYLSYELVKWNFINIWETKFACLSSAFSYKICRTAGHKQILHFFLYEMTLCNGLKFNDRTEVLLHKIKFSVPWSCCVLRVQNAIKACYKKPLCMKTQADIFQSIIKWLSHILIIYCGVIILQ